MVTNDDRAAAARGRSRLFWALADGLLRGPRSEAWRQAAAAPAAEDGDAADPLEGAWRNLAEALRGLDEAARLRLAAEHTRLFGGLGEGSGPPPPFESAWRRGEAGEIARAVVHCYAAAGFADIDPEAGPQDHLVVELKFMALLALREAEAREGGDEGAATARLDQQRRFLDGHLLAWVPRWAEVLAGQTREPAYWALAGLVGAALGQAVEELMEA